MVVTLWNNRAERHQVSCWSFHTIKAWRRKEGHWWEAPQRSHFPDSMQPSSFCGGVGTNNCPSATSLNGALLHGKQVGVKSIRRWKSLFVPSLFPHSHTRAEAWITVGSVWLSSTWITLAEVGICSLQFVALTLISTRHSRHSWC